MEETRPDNRKVPATSRDQLRRLGSIVEAYGFRLLVIGCLAAMLVLTVRLNDRVSDIESQTDESRKGLGKIQSHMADIDRRVDDIRTSMPRR